MNRRILVFASLLALLGGSAAGQNVPDTRMRGFTLTGLIGGAANTDLQRVTAPDATAVAPLRRVTADTSPVVAGAIGYWPSRHWGIRVHGSFAPTRLEVRESGGELGVEDDVFAQSGARLWTADLSLMIRAPVTPAGRIVPYLVIGGGVTGFATDRAESVVEATGEALEAHSIEPAGVIGLGTHIPLQRGRLALTFELTDHIFTTPIRDPVLGTDPDEQVGVSNHIRLLTGVTVRFR